MSPPRQPSPSHPAVTAIQMTEPSSSWSQDGVASFINVGAATPIPTGDIYSRTALQVWPTPAPYPLAHPLSSSSSASYPPSKLFYTHCPQHVPLLLLLFLVAKILLSITFWPPHPQQQKEEGHPNVRLRGVEGVVWWWWASDEGRFWSRYWGVSSFALSYTLSFPFFTSSML